MEEGYESKKFQKKQKPGKTRLSQAAKPKTSSAFMGRTSTELFSSTPISRPSLQGLIQMIDCQEHDGSLQDYLGRVTTTYRPVNPKFGVYTWHVSRSRG